MQTMTGTYMLQANRAKFNGNDVDPTCPLCKEDLEDTSLPIQSKLNLTSVTSQPIIYFLCVASGVFIYVVNLISL